HTLEEEGARLPRLQRLPGLRREALVEEWVPQAALAVAAIEDQQLGPVVGRGEPRGERGAAPGLGVGARTLVEGERRVVGPAERHRLHEDLDRPPAGEPDLPRLLVAQVQLE